MNRSYAAVRGDILHERDILVGRFVDWCPRQSVRDGVRRALLPDGFEDVGGQALFQALDLGAVNCVQRLVVEDRHERLVVDEDGELGETEQVHPVLPYRPFHGRKFQLSDGVSGFRVGAPAGSCSDQFPLFSVTLQQGKAHPPLEGCIDVEGCLEARVEESEERWLEQGVLDCVEGPAVVGGPDELALRTEQRAHWLGDCRDVLGEPGQLLYQAKE